MAFSAANFRYHDFRSALPDPALALSDELQRAIQAAPTYEQRHKIALIRDAHHNGEWDATPAESDAWAASSDGQDALGRLARGE